MPSKHYGENAGGGLYSTVSDLYQYVLALENNQLLPEKLANLLFESHIESGNNEFEGYAWSIKNFGDEKIHFAAGSGYGTKSVIARSPDQNNFIGITSNWGNTPILNLLRDIFFITRGNNVELPSTNYLANPNNYQDKLGTYKFEQEKLKKNLGINKTSLKLHVFENKLFLNDELLAKKEDDRLGLTYTDELVISFDQDKMKILINDNLIIGKKILNTNK